MRSVPHDASSDTPAETRSDAAEQDDTKRADGTGAPADDEASAAMGDDQDRSGDEDDNGGDEDTERQMRQPDAQAGGAAAPEATENNESPEIPTEAALPPTPPTAAAEEGADASPVQQDKTAPTSGDDESRPAGSPTPGPADTPAPAETAGPTEATGATGPGERTEPGPATEPNTGTETSGPAGPPSPPAPPGPPGAPAPANGHSTAAPPATGDDLPVTTELPQVDVPDTPSSKAPPPTQPVPPAFPAPPAPPTPPPSAPPPRPAYPTYRVPTTAASGADADTAKDTAVDATRIAPAGPPAPPAPGSDVTDRPAGAYRDTTAATVPPDERPRHLRGPARASRHDEDGRQDQQRRRMLMLLGLAPVVLLLLLLVAWAVDTAALSGQVVRNVELAGRPIGGVGEASLPEMVSDVAEDVAAREVVIQVPGQAQGWQPIGTAQSQTYEATAEALGLTLDRQATVQAAQDVGRDDSLFIRPFKWAASFFSTREVPLQYSMSESHTAAALQLLQGDQRQQPTEPTIRLTEEGFVPVAGQPGTGLNPERVAEDLLAAARSSTEGRITIEAESADIEPYFSQADVETLANRANEMTADGLRLVADGHNVDISAQQLRQWITPTEIDEGGERRLDLAFNTQAAQEAIPGMFTDLNAEPQNARVELQNGRPTVVPGANGVVCCGDQAGANVWEALQGGETELELEVQVVEPEHTTEEVQGWGITQVVGGGRAHRDGADIGGPPGYTTYYDPGAPRVTNIHRIAELVDGAVVAPGESFSINDHVGERTTAKGFVPAGAIRDGIHVDEVGGGVSQFFTTMFNAAFFAALEIDEYQAHTENFPRYPDGREATGGFPNPDLVITNDTPYGLLIDTSYTDTSVTVSLWSTPHATAEQTNISSNPQGNCTVVTTTRTRTFPDGRTDQDTFRATYRPGEGLFC